MDIETRKEINKRFIFVAHELINKFPNLDLRFNLKMGTKSLRYKAAAVSGDIFELPLEERRPEEILYDAIFNIKQIAELFDA